MLPYRVFRAFEAVIPVEATGTVYSSQSAANAGFADLHAWLQKAETVWNTEGKGNRRFVEQLDYIRQLSAQFPIVKLRVVYAKAGALPAACIIDDGTSVIDHKLYWSAPATLTEAHYLVAILNSETARARAAGYQSRGQFGARDFDKVIFNLPIPRFDAKVKLHRDLAAAASVAETAAAAVALPDGIGFQQARKRIRAALIADGVAARIEALVTRLIGPPPAS